MSQHRFSSTMKDIPVFVIIGHDRPLSEFFYQVHDQRPDVSEDDDVSTTSMAADDIDVSDLDSIHKALTTMGIAVPQPVLDAVGEDAQNGGSNRIADYS